MSEEISVLHALRVIPVKVLCSCGAERVNMSSTKVYLAGFTAFKRIFGVSILIAVKNSGKKKVRIRRLTSSEKDEVSRRKRENSAHR